MPRITLPESRRRAPVALPESMWSALDKIAEESVETHPPSGLSRNDIIEHFLKWALEAHDAERRGRFTEWALETEKTSPEKKKR